MNDVSALSIQAGPTALAHLRKHGLRAQDIAIVPAAAGGPKGLIFNRLDQWLFGSWLTAAPRERILIGASIGAWRMAAACAPDPVAAFDRLAESYAKQTYPPKPSARYVTETCLNVLSAVVGGQEEAIASHPHYRLHILVSRGRRILHAPGRDLAVSAGFGLAAMANTVSRTRLASHLSRLVVGDQRDPSSWLQTGFDAFATQFAPLSSDNLVPALLASGTLPLTMEPVRHIPHAPSGTYWDGGLIDYHLALPYSRMADTANGGLVLYPHFGRDIVPGWLDKSLPWRRAGKGRHRAWLDNVLMISPSPAFLNTLPRGKLPDRKDFHFYGLDHDARIRNWKRAVHEGERLRDALAAFVEKPDLGLVTPFRGGRYGKIAD